MPTTAASTTTSAIACAATSSPTRPGRYTLETIVPGLYTGRTRHIHLKVQAPGARILTSQLYFPADAARNARDGLYRPDLLMDVQQTDNGQLARFDFVVTTA